MRRGLTFSEISERILKMRDEQQTYFVIDTLEPLRKNGRLTGLQAFFRNRTEHQTGYGGGSWRYH